MLTFDKASHTYRVSGKLVPGVTSLLDALHSFAGVSREALEAAQARGTFVHDLCTAYDHDELDEDALASMDIDEETGVSRWVPYLSAYKQFLHDHQPNWAGIEEMGYSSTYSYAGTPDRWGSLNTPRMPVKRAVVDIKSSVQSHPVWGIQTAAYRQIIAERFPRDGWLTARRFTLQLLPTGKYNLLPWDSPTDWPAFMALLTLSQWRAKHGL